MTHPNDKQPGDPVHAAIAELRDGTNEVAQSDEWKRDFLSYVWQLEKSVHNYRLAMAHDRHEVFSGEYRYRDMPDVKWSGKHQDFIPKRKGGFIDAAHKSEYETGKHLSAMLAMIELAKFGAEDLHTMRLCMQGLGEELANVGMYLDQRKQIGSTGTMPEDPDERPTQHRQSGTFFRRLLKLRAEEQKKR